MSSSQDPVSAAGSSTDEPVFVVMGKLRKPHGVRGEMVMTVLTEFPELLESGQKVYLGEDFHEQTVRSVRPHRDDLLIAFEGITDRDEVGYYRNTMLFMDEGDFPNLPEDEYYLHDLVGMEVVTDTGQSLGELKEILVTGANDVYLVQKGEEREILIPAIEEVVLEIDFDQGTVLVRPLPGLLDGS